MNYKLNSILIFLFILLGCKEEFRLNKPSSVQGDPQELFSMVNNHDKVIFYSLEPSGMLKEKKIFHNYSILGSKELKGKEHKELIFENLYKAIEENEGDVAPCFMPRHGIRVSKGEKILDLVICFQCSSVVVHSTKRTSIAINGDRNIFDKVAKKLNMELTKN